MPETSIIEVIVGLIIFAVLVVAFVPAMFKMSLEQGLLFLGMGVAAFLIIVAVVFGGQGGGGGRTRSPEEQAAYNKRKAELEAERDFRSGRGEE